jgi:autoinducer 2 (AI-2) kinase
VLAERWIVEGNAGEMGGAYQWLVELMCPCEEPAKAMERLDRLAARVSPGAEGNAAYLGPTFTHIADVSLRTGGMLFPVPISFEPPDRAKLARSALESFAFAIRYNADRLAQFGGPAKWFSVGGGMTRSRTFREALTAALGGAASFSPSGETSTLGAITCAAFGAGEGGLQELAEKRKHEMRVWTTEAALTAEYKDLYEAWRARERRLTDIEL